MDAEDESARKLTYQHFILLAWQERDGPPNARTPWRFSIQDPHTGERIGFQDAASLAAYLDRWVEEKRHDAH